MTRAHDEMEEGNDIGASLSKSEGQNLDKAELFESDSGEADEIDRSEPIYSIGEVVKMTGVSKARLNDYDKKGILVPTRMKKDIDQEWRLYSEEDIDCLELIDVLLAYGFNLNEIKQIIDGEASILDSLDEKLVKLKRQETRLGNLRLFAKMADLTDCNLYTALSRGPEEIDELANAFRDSQLYEDALVNVKVYTEEERSEVFEELDKIVDDFMVLPKHGLLASKVEAVNEFYEWWDKYISPIKMCGMLGFWSIFEDGRIIAERVEERGGEDAPAFLQMTIFYLTMRSLVVDVQDLIKQVSDLADSDVLLATARADDLVDMMCEALGLNSLDRDFATIGACIHVLDYLKRILGDADLRDELALDEVIDIRHKDIDMCIYVLVLMSGKTKEFIYDPETFIDAMAEYVSSLEGPGIIDEIFGS